MSKTTVAKKGLATSQLAIVALVVIAILGAGWLINKNSTKNSNSNKSSNSSAATTFSGKTLVFKEYGVKINLPTELEGLSYTTSSSPEVAGSVPIVLAKLNMDNYTKLAVKCVGAPAGTEESFATLIKTPQLGNIPPSVDSLKQFGDFYIGNLGPALQNPTCRDNATQKSLNDLYIKLSAALKTAFSTATKV